MTWSVEYRLAETSVLDPVIAYLLDNVEDKMEAVAARYDGLPLDPPVKIAIYDPAVAGESEYPVWYAIPVEATVLAGPGGLRHGFQLLQLIEFALIVERANEDGDSEEPLKRRGMRHAVALLELLAESVQTTGVEWGLGGQPRIFYLPLYTPPDSQRVFCDVRVQISTKVQESGASE